MNKIVRFFPEVDMRNGHDGLRALARKEGVNVDSLGAGEYALFLNRSQRMVKMFASGNVIAFLKHSKKLDPRTIALIPRYFNGAKINYNAALEAVLKKEFSRKDAR